MAIKTLILGESGTGKSASLRKFDPDDLLVINVASKPLPFKNKFERLDSDDYKKIIKAMKETKKKIIVVDDAQYNMSFQYMRRIKENGWDKWNDIQGDFFNLIQYADKLPEDVRVYFLSHIMRDENGFEKIKTMGKMLDEKITIEGLFTTVLRTSVSDGNYYFITQNNGHDTVKSPMGMFPSYAIDNDLKYVDEKICNYYEIGDFKTDEEMEKADEAAKTDLQKEEPKTSRRSRKKVETETKEDKRTRRKKLAEESKDKEETSKLGSEMVEGDDDIEFEEPKTRTRRSRKREDVSTIDDETAPTEVKTNGLDVEIEEEKPRRKRRARA